MSIRLGEKQEPPIANRRKEMQRKINEIAQERVRMIKSLEKEKLDLILKEKQIRKDLGDMVNQIQFLEKQLRELPE